MKKNYMKQWDLLKYFLKIGLSINEKIIQLNKKRKLRYDKLFKPKKIRDNKS